MKEGIERENNGMEVLLLGLGIADVRVVALDADGGGANIKYQRGS